MLINQLKKFLRNFGLYVLTKWGVEINLFPLPVLTSFLFGGCEV